MKFSIAIEDLGLDVCHLTGTKNTDGRGLAVLSQAAVFQQQGHEVELLVLPGREIHSKWACKFRVRHVEKGPFPKCSSSGKEYDFILVNSLAAEPFVGSIPFLYQPHEIEKLRNKRIGSPNPETEKIQDKMFKKALGILVPSREIKDWVDSTYHFSNVILAPHGIDTTVFAPRKREEARRLIGYDRDDSMMLFVGRLERRKGLHVLMDTFESVPENVHLMVVGFATSDPSDVEVQREVENWIREKGYQNRVHVKSNGVAWFDLPNYYSAADVVVLPSLAEPFGLPTLEAVGCGVPVVGSDIEGFRDIIRNELDGLLCPPGDVSCFTKAVMDVLQNGKWRCEERVSERVKHAGNFRWETSIHAIEAFLNAYLGKGRKTAMVP